MRTRGARARARCPPRSARRGRSTMPWLIARPSPVPCPTSLVVKNGSKMRCRTSGGCRARRRGRRSRPRRRRTRVAIQMLPPSPTASQALARMFMNTWLIWPGSHSTRGQVAVVAVHRDAVAPARLEKPQASCRGRRAGRRPCASPRPGARSVRRSCTMRRGALGAARHDVDDLAAPRRAAAPPRQSRRAPPPARAAA